jgi:hypothetical protein
MRKRVTEALSSINFTPFNSSSANDSKHGSGHFPIHLSPYQSQLFFSFRTKLAMSDDGYDGGAPGDDYGYGGPTFDEAYVRCSIKILHLPLYIFSSSL